MKLTLVKREQLGNEVYNFVFRPLGSFTWQAGEYLIYSLPHENHDSRGTKRLFTIASAPFERDVFLAARIAELNRSSFKQALMDLPIGGEIDVIGPQGHFMPDSGEQSRIFIAGGIGITPMRSIILDLDHRAERIDGALIYANRDGNFIFRDDFEAVASRHPEFKIVYIVEPQTITADAIKTAGAGLSQPTYFVSGPKGMVIAMLAAIVGLGVEEKKIKRDYFPGYDWQPN